MNLSRVNKLMEINIKGVLNMKKSDINESIAYIQDGDEYFQVLNETGDDWDEQATAALYQSYRG